MVETIESNYLFVLGQVEKLERSDWVVQNGIDADVRVEQELAVVVNSDS